MGIKQRAEALRFRAFIAISLPKHVQAELSELTSRLVEFKLLFRIVPIANTHLTLRFLGHRTKEELTLISSELSFIADSFLSFSLQITSVNRFPVDKRSRLVVVNLKPSSVLKELEKKIFRSLAKFNFLEPPDHFFSPHITIARLRSRGLTKSEWQKVLAGGMMVKKWRVGGIKLIASTLDQVGSNYKVLKKFCFRT